MRAARSAHIGPNANHAAVTDVDSPVRLRRSVAVVVAVVDGNVVFDHDLTVVAVTLQVRSACTQQAQQPHADGTGGEPRLRMSAHHRRSR